MISTVLYEKKGVITEDRFKKMTAVQWLFHYKEIEKKKSEENREKFELFNALKQSIEYSGILSHPKVDLERVINALRSDGLSPEQAAKEAIEFVEEHKDIFPEAMTVKLDQKKKEKVKTGKIDRNLGIIITE